MAEDRVVQTLVIGTVNPGTLTSDDIRRIRGEGTAIVRDMEASETRVEGDGVTIDVLVAEGDERPPPPIYGGITVARAMNALDAALLAEGLAEYRRTRLLADFLARLEAQ
jgi:hypothetical protein